MDAIKEPTPPPANHHISDHLANERTFLAWIRTSISVIGLGFVVARFNVWLREISVRMDHTQLPRQVGFSLPLGVAMMTFGGILALLAPARYRAVKLAIDQNRAGAAENSTVAVAIVVVGLAIALTVYMVVSV